MDIAPAMDRPTVFFLGAGASHDDGFPLTRHLIAGVAHYLEHPTAHATDVESRYDVECVRAYLRTVYRVKDADLLRASQAWEKCVQPRGTWDLPSSLPDLTEVLSALDILIDEEWALGRYEGRFPCSGGGTVPGQELGPAQPEISSRSMDARELRTIRRAFNRALAYSFTALDRQRIEDTGQLRGLTTTRFARLLRTGDTVITSNWDILLDRALDWRYEGTAPADYGTAICLAPDCNGSGERSDGRPVLLKLHGSMNWLQCRRCMTLFVDPKHCIATGEYRPDDGSRQWVRECQTCKFGLTTLMVTPTYLKQYRSLHLSQIWANALWRLRASHNWVFIGYSLPADDVHIRTMLLRAFRMRAEDGHVTDVHVVSKCAENRDVTELQAWYDKLVPISSVSSQGFERYLEDVLEPARSVSPATAVPPARAPRPVVEPAAAQPVGR